MTATPIPRTLSLTLYGDLDYSVIDEMPPGRKPVVTEWLPDDKKRRVYNFVKEAVRAGGRAFVVCPLIEESEKLQAEAATILAERLRKQVFRDVEVGLLHGRMATDEKETAMRRFKSGETSVLVSTSVVEVGVDIPEATIMVIEGADRFGLAQLHQLRGRVGRGKEQSFCFLICNAQSPDLKRRMEVMQETNDGFKIAEADLEIRGPGEFFGTRQHGMPDLKIANPLKDYNVLLEAREEAAALIVADPQLTGAGHERLRALLQVAFPEDMGLVTVS
jgi:ATP-dependent DNA helicase RecG